MTNMKTTKKALIFSALSLLLCFSMLVGTTFAWFTDSVTSSGNIIKSGTLEVALDWADGTEALDKANWADASAGKIFKNDKWEPGYTEARHLKISNKGTLALKYELAIIPNGTVSALADVIDVYYIDNGAQVADRTALSDNNKIGTLRDLINGGICAGSLEAKDEKIVTLVLKMQESAGNEYQDLSIGTDFAIQLLATQMTAEPDSFDNQYDANAPFSVWNGVVPTEMPASLVVDTNKKLISINDAAAFAYLNTLINAADFYDNYGSKWKYSIELNTDIDLANNAWTPIVMDNFVAFNGNSHTIKNLNIDTNANETGLFASIKCNDMGVTYVRNLTIDGAFVRGANSVGVVAGNGKQAAVLNVTVDNATVVGNKYIGGIFGHGNGSANDCVVKNSNIIIPEGGEKEAGGLIGYLSNDGKESTNNKVISGNLVENVTVSAPAIASALVSQPNSSNKGGAIIVIERNTVKNTTVITADDTADIFVSNNVNGKAVVKDNTEIGCVVNKDTPVAVVIDTADDLIAALEAKKDVFMTDDVKINPAGMSNAYGTTGINVKNGQTIDGNGNILDIKGAGGTWDSGICTSGGVIKNLTVTGSFRGIFIKKDATNNSKVILENVIIDGTTYTISVDSGTGKGLEATDCVFNGWTSYAGTLGDAKFVNCSFGAGNGYNFSRPYAPTTYVGCDFAEGHRIDPRAAVTFKDCTINGVPLTAENLATLVTGNISNATVIA